MPKAKKSENAEGLAALKSLSPPTGPAPGDPLPAPGALPTTRLHGRWATASIGGVTLPLFDWTVEFSMETFDATAHGEVWKVRVAGDQSWTARASGYFVPSQNTAIKSAGVSGADPTVVAFTGYQDHTGGTAIFTGNGFITRANFQAPMAMVVQEIEITSSGEPSVGI
jgi:hypothetical protein